MFWSQLRVNLFAYALELSLQFSFVVWITEIYNGIKGLFFLFAGSHLILTFVITWYEGWIIVNLKYSVPTITLTACSELDGLTVAEIMTNLTSLATVLLLEISKFGSAVQYSFF